MKRLICLFLCILLSVTGGLLASADTPENEGEAEVTETENAEPQDIEALGFMMLSENENFQLYVNVDTGVFKIRDLRSESIWSSNPDEQSIADISQTIKVQLNSQLRISFLDESRNYVSATSFDNCIANGSYSMETVKENEEVIGFKTVYDFADSAHCFKIPLKVVLTEDGVSVELCFNEIEEYGTSKLCQIEMLPFFSAGVGEQEGFLLVPDGNGAIIDFKDRYKNADDYEETVYGRDSAVNINLKALPNSEGVKMPVFAMKKGDSAFFAEIENADALARICASSANDRYQASSVWSSFCYRECDETGIVDGDNLIRTVRMADETPSSVSPVVRFRFLNGEDANVEGMAGLYREILIKKYNLKPLESDRLKLAPYLEIFGKTNEKSNFLGISYNKTVKATTFKDVENIYKALTDAGVDDLSIGLFGFSKGGYDNKYITKQKFDSSLGGNKGFESLLKTAENADIFAVYDLNRDYSSVKKLFKGKGFIQSLNSLTVVREQGALSTGSSAGLQKWLLVSGEQIRKNSQKLIKSLKNPKEYGILYQNMGSELYNNFNKSSHTDRQQLIKSYHEILNNTKNNVKSVASDGANIYMLSGADFLTEVPLYSSGYEIFSSEIPFYTTVLKGYVKMASKPLNNIADVNEAAKKCKEYGVNPTYRITKCSADELKDTNLRFLYNSKFSDLKDVILKHYEIIS